MGSVGDHFGVAVAVGAGRGHLREDQALVAVTAARLAVRRLQRETGAAVVEGQRLAQRRPTFRRVAGRAVPGQLAVRATGDGGCVGLGSGRRSVGAGEHGEHAERAKSRDLSRVPQDQ